MWGLTRKEIFPRRCSRSATARCSSRVRPYHTACSSWSRPNAHSPVAWCDLQQIDLLPIKTAFVVLGRVPFWVCTMPTSSSEKMYEDKLEARHISTLTGTRR